jgi:hypothetical protein
MSPASFRPPIRPACLGPIFAPKRRSEPNLRLNAFGRWKVSNAKGFEVTNPPQSGSLKLYASRSPWMRSAKELHEALYRRERTLVLAEGASIDDCILQARRSLVRSHTFTRPQRKRLKVVRRGPEITGALPLDAQEVERVSPRAWIPEVVEVTKPLVDKRSDSSARAREGLNTRARWRDEKERRRKSRGVLLVHTNSRQGLLFAHGRMR